MIEQNVKELLAALEKGNGFGEKVTLVAATKTRTAKEIARAIDAGITDVGENKVQEFRDKYDLFQGGNRHFIGRLQTNKVKYLIGKTYLYHSADRDELIEEIATRSVRAGIVIFRDCAGGKRRYLLSFDGYEQRLETVSETRRKYDTNRNRHFRRTNVSRKTDITYQKSRRYARDFFIYNHKNKLRGAQNLR